MSGKVLLIIICSIVIINFILELTLSFLNYRSMTPELPRELPNFFDEENYKKSREYEQARTKFGFIVSTFDVILLISMLTLGGFAFIDTLARHVSDNEILITLIFFGIIVLGSDIIKTPFSLYSTFIIEEKFGFNKTTLKTFISDKIKGWFLTAIIGGLLLGAITFFYYMFPKMFWVYAWVAMSIFTILLTMTYSTLIVPLFNKQTPLEEGELKREIENFSRKAGFNLREIYRIDGSKRSTKANAYFSGFGPKKRIVLFDTLIQEMTIPEIVAVLAHEIGHYKKKHIITGLILGTAQTGILLFIFSLFARLPQLSQAMGSNIHSFHLALLAFSMLFTPINLVLGVFMNMLSRRNEFQADRYAKENYSGTELASALKKLSVKNLSNLTPHPLFVFFYYSHPTVLQRLKELE